MLSVSTCKAVPALRINQVDIIINAFVYMIYNYIICIASYILLVSALPVKVINTLTNYIQCELISFFERLHLQISQN